MPNWCGNSVTFKHDDPAMIRRAKTAFVDGKFLEEFIPLPDGKWDWHWCVENWGTKWDVGNGDGVNEVSDTTFTVYFDSAWSPPIRAYEQMSDLGFDVNAIYYEPGVAFAGRWTTESGDDFYDFSNMTAEQVAKELPQDLDEAFGISESMAEWEADNDEDHTS